MPTDNDYWSHVRPNGPTQAGEQLPQAEAPQASSNQHPSQQGWQPGQANGPQAGWAPAYGAAPSPQAVAYQAPAPKQKSRGWIVGVVLIVCAFAFTAFCVHSCTTAVGSIGSNGGSSLDALTGDAIGIIDIDGTIQYDGSACSPEGLKELLDEAEENDGIKAVVLRVNSGGGAATAGEEMAEYVRQFAEVKPVVVSSASINASAAYEISSQSDYIYVAKSTEIGAIGTAMQLSDISGLLDMLGVNMEVITSAEEKDSSYGYRPLTDQERAEYQRMVDQINDVFIENVSDGRDMPLEEVRALATGMPFTGIDAVENGLADEIGTREDAIAKAAELAGITDYTTVDLYFGNYDLSSLADLFGSDKTSVDGLVDILASPVRR